MKKVKKNTTTKFREDNPPVIIKDISVGPTRRGSAMPFIIAFLVFVVIVGVFVYFAMGKKSSVADSEGTLGNNPPAVEKKVSGVSVNNSVFANADALPAYSGTLLAGTSAPLLDFVKSDYDIALQSGKLVVLYFYANWCPSCKAEFPVMQKIFNASDSDAFVGFRVNYKDEYTDADEENLARELGIAYQHTKIFMKNGQSILKSPETWDENRYTMELDFVLDN